MNAGRSGSSLYCTYRYEGMIFCTVGDDASGHGPGCGTTGPGGGCRTTAENRCPLVAAFTLTGVVWPDGTTKVCPGCSGNVVAVSTRAAGAPLVSTNSVSTAPIPWSPGAAGFCRQPP